MQTFECTKCKLTFQTNHKGGYELCDGCYTATYMKKCVSCNVSFMTKYLGKDPRCPGCHKASFPHRTGRGSEVSEDGFRIVRRR